VDLGLRGKAALVIGGSQGIGAEAARALAGEGARVAVAARSRGPLEQLAAEIRAGGGEAVVCVGDLTAPPDAARLVDEAVAKLGGLDVLILSVGAARGGRFLDLDDAVWEEAFALKFMGMVRVLRAAIPVMQGAGAGRVVVVVGNNGRQPNAAMLPGSAANAACLAVIKGLADAVARDGVTINALNPGPTRTARWDRLIEGLARQSDRSAAETEAEQLERTPMGRIGDAAAMGRLAVILASDVAEMVTGTSLTADGGATKSLA
jgi:3-oxoacyl-[acyl-carrier protein] reductase